MPENFVDHIALRIAKQTFVVLIKGDDGKPNLVVDPGMGRPWSSRNKRFADQVAKECDGEARTWEEAFKIIKKAHPEFERELHARIANAAASASQNLGKAEKKVPQVPQVPPAQSATPTILDGHGREVK